MNADRFSHLAALRVGLSDERARLSCAKTQAERELRAVWVAQREREIAGEEKFLGIAQSSEIKEMQDDELLSALGE